jgi:hypothetical protein
MEVKAMQAKEAKRYWTGDVGPKDDVGDTIEDVFIDGATTLGPWAIMTPKTHRRIGKGIGQGLGQKYKRQPDGKWLKVEG